MLQPFLYADQRDENRKEDYQRMLQRAAQPAEPSAHEPHRCPHCGSSVTPVPDFLKEPS